MPRFEVFRVFARCLRNTMVVCTAVSAAVPVWAAVRVQGGSDALNENVSLYVQSLPLDAQRPSSQKRVLSAAAEAAQALGYYQARFHLTQNDEDWLLTIDPQQRVKWLAPELTINGEPATDESVPFTSELIAQLRKPMDVGEGLNHQEYKHFKDAWLQVWQQQGYWKARYTHAELRVDINQHQAQARLALDTGPHYILQSLTFNGSELSDSLLQRIIPLRTGEPVTQQTLVGTQRNLENSHYFSQVDVDVQHEQAKKGLEQGVSRVNVNLQDSPYHQISVGAGYGTDTGVRGRLRLENPHINRRGHRLVNDIEVNDISREWTANYQIPLMAEGKNPLDTRLEFTASYDYEDVEDTESTIWNVGGFISDIWGRGWQVRYGANLLAEEEIIGNEPAKDTLYLLPAVYFSRIKAPLTLDPLYGNSTSLSVSGSSPSLGADTFFVRVLAGHKRLFSLGGSQTLLTRVELGTIWTDDINQVPLSQRFFAGGDQSVRGYDYSSLAVRNQDGTLRGGRNLNTGSLEYSVKFLPRWRAAVFTDVGRAYDDTSAPWNLSAGFGVRWLSPIGSIRVDLATPINNDEYSGVRLHISMGGVL